MKRRRMLVFIVFSLLFGVALLVVTFFAAGSDAQLMFGKDTFKPTPGTVALFWIAALVASASIGGVALAVELVKAEYAAHEKAPPPPPEQTPQEELMSQYEARGYVERADLQFAPDAAAPSPVADDLPLSAKLMAAPAVQNRAGVWTRKAVLAYDNGVPVDFKLVVLFDDETWKRGDNEHFEQRRAGRPVHIESALTQDYIRDATEGTDWVFCYGLASSDTADQERNERLSDNRACNLCIALLNLDYVKPTRAIAVGLGYALTDVSTKQQLSRQRAALIVGVTVLENMRVRDIAAGVARLIEVDGVSVDNYSRPITEAMIVRGLTKGLYTGMQNVGPVDADDNFSLIGPQPEKN